MRYKLAFVALLVFLNGCLTAPWQAGGYFADYRQNSLPVEGCFPFGDFPIEIWAYRPPYPPSLWGEERKLTTVSTSSTPAYTETYNGVQTSWYCFSTEVSIPRDLWVSIGSWPSNAEVPATPAHHRSYINAFYYDFYGTRTPFYTYNNNPDECFLPWGWSQITGDADGDTIPDFGAEYCALQTDWVEVRGF